jgi:hypothetical protein
MDTETRSAVGQTSVGSGASRSESLISDQGTLGAQGAGRRSDDRSGRDRRRASPASMSDRWRAVAGRHGWTPVGRQARASNAGTPFGQVAQLPPLYDALSPVTEAVRTFCTTMTCSTNATNSNTIRPQQGPRGATQGHQGTTKRPVILTSTPHALKLLEADQPKLR